MSNSKRDRNRIHANVTNSVGRITAEKSYDTDPQPLRGFSRADAFLHARMVATLIMAFLALGPRGAVMKYLDGYATPQKRSAATNRSALFRLNPFLADPTPTSMSHLSKENIYAGSPLLAVEGANFYIKRSTDLSYYAVQFGLSTDISAPGEYDGDGEVDIGVFHSSTNTFYSLNSSNQTFLPVLMGSISGTRIVSADFDGDGIAEHARSDWGIWNIPQNTTRQVINPTVSMGTCGDIAVRTNSTRISNATLPSGAPQLASGGSATAMIRRSELNPGERMTTFQSLLIPEGDRRGINELESKKEFE